MQHKKIFLASSSELVDERRDFEIAIYRKNKDWVRQGVFLELILWEDFLDTLSPTRLQDEYNRAIRHCDVFVLLFWSKVGRYTGEEFDTAVGQFQATRRPFIFTYFKDVEPPAATPRDASVAAFQARLAALGHFYTAYKNSEGLQLHFIRQLDKLVANGFITLQPPGNEAPIAGVTTYAATLSGNGASAQGEHATAVGAGGIHVGGNSTGNHNTGTQIFNTGGGAWVGGSVTVGGDFIGRDQMVAPARARPRAPSPAPADFATLTALVAQHAAAAERTTAEQQVQQLQAASAPDSPADDEHIAALIDELLARVPPVSMHVIALFSTPPLKSRLGPVSRYVLDKWQRQGKNHV